MNLEKLNLLAADLPDDYKTKALALVTRMGETIEGIGDEPVKWRPSTVKLVQATSDRSKLPKGAQMGDIIIGESVIQTPAAVIPLRSWDARQYWSPDQNEAKMFCSSPDADLGYIGLKCRECPHSKFDEEAKKIDCNKIKVVMVVAADLSDIFLINFAKTSYKIGNDWQMMQKKAGVATYRRIYGLKSETSKAYKNVETIAIETYDDDKRNTPESILVFLKELFDQVGTDRKEHLDDFHKIVLSRKQDTNLLTGPASGVDSEIVLLGTDSTPSDDSTPAPATAKTGAAAKKYTV
jgi:hypothetical protein